MQQPVPEDHDVTDRVAALRYTREEGRLTTGVLYRVEQPSMLDNMAHVRQQALARFPEEPTIAELQQRYHP